MCLDDDATRFLFRLAGALILGLLCCQRCEAQIQTSAPQVESYGPYKAIIAPGGPGLKKALPKGSALLDAGASWTLLVWFQSEDRHGSGALIAGLGSPLDPDSRYVGLKDDHAILRFGSNNVLISNAALAGSGWHMLAATESDGTARLYVDGKEAGSAKLLLGRVEPLAGMAPVDLPAREHLVHFGGQIGYFEVVGESLSRGQIAQRYALRPEFGMDVAEVASAPWPIQLKGQSGLRAPQDPSLMPHGREALQNGIARSLPAQQTSLRAMGDGQWEIAANWQLAIASQVMEPAKTISQPTSQTNSTASSPWMSAVVPGTVLTTLIDRGVYPDPDFGLNNLAIPETLNKQDYWYRVQFPTPALVGKRRVSLTFNGINYAAEVWLNGGRLGDVKGAFIRGTFNVTEQLIAHGVNELAVRIKPPPHPGIPQEQSLKGGPGPNGGLLAIDGPTFLATEGWDWVPAIRDRDSGIWQNVVLRVSDELRLGDPQVITHLPLPDTSYADVEITVPVINSSSQAVPATVTASFEGVKLETKVLASPGASSVVMRSRDFAQLHVQQPRLWWPNGYGKPELYHLDLSVSSSRGLSDRRQTTFGIREISYELSLFDHTGDLRRVEVSPTEAHLLNTTVVNVTHESMRNTAHGWAASLTLAGEESAAVKPLPNDDALTDLIIKVNGVRIAARGGNWGMDDSRKRVSREHLEPFFRLHQEAHLNIIRNWIGQNTEEIFYQLADEYGMMVWNDFWESTQDYNVEPDDTDLFLRNARDVVARFRNHPSIVMWCGRNEGVPQPALNQGLIDVFAQMDGTRYYTPSSNRVNLRDSGPYMYQGPSFYYGANNQGFSVELGIPSFSTLESFQHSIAPKDQWPISDAWAYHDWHQGAGGDTHPWMEKLEEEFGAGADLKDFERKAQMFNYVGHRAIFEGFNQHLWAPNSGRLLWMTQPAWPSNLWQILNSDYDTSASYYAVKKACEPVHIQLDLTDYRVTVVNTSREATGPMEITARILSLDNKVLWSHTESASIAANSVAPVFTAEMQPLLATDDVVLVRLEARDAAGQLVSDNLYWLAAKDVDYRELTGLKSATIDAVAGTSTVEGQPVVQVRLKNRGTVAALEVKLTPKSLKTGERVLPVYLSDNYVSLLPGEERTVTIRSSEPLDARDMSIGVRGWNLDEISIGISNQ